MAFRSGVSRSLRFFRYSVRSSSAVSLTSRRWYCMAEEGGKSRDHLTGPSSLGSTVCCVCVFSGVQVL